MTSSIAAMLSCLLVFSLFAHESISFPSSELQQPYRAIERHPYPDAACLATKGDRPICPFVTLAAHISNRLLQTLSGASYAESDETVCHPSSKCRQPVCGRAPPQ